MQVTGTLSFCVEPSANGVATFEVFLQDDGGRQRGGLDEQGPALVTIRVYPTNQAPSFQVCSGCQPQPNGTLVPACVECNSNSTVCQKTCALRHAASFSNFSACIQRCSTEMRNATSNMVSTPSLFSEMASKGHVCCDHHVLAWKSFYQRSTQHVLPKFASGILLGHTNADGHDMELKQDYSFSTTGASMSQDFSMSHVFSKAPLLHKNGTLEFDVLLNRTGDINFTVIMHDTGFLQDSAAGTLNYTSTHYVPYAGVNKSYENIRFTLAATYALIHFNSTGSVELPKDLVLDTARRIIASREGLPPARILPLHDEMGLQMVGIDTAEALYFVARGSEYAQWVSAALPANNGIRLWNSKAFVKNFDHHRPAFRLSMHVISILGFEYPEESPFELNSFIQDVIAPIDSPLDQQGQQRIFFEVKELRWRRQEGDVWHETNGLNHTVLSSAKITLVCTPHCLESIVCCNGSFVATKMPHSHGEAEYEIRIKGGSANADSEYVQVVRVQAVFSMMPLVEVGEDDESVQNFIQSFVDFRISDRIWDQKETPLSPLLQYKFVDDPYSVTAPGYIKATLKESVMLEHAVDAYILVKQIPQQHLSPVLNMPRVELRMQDNSIYGELVFNLRPFAAGNVSFTLTIVVQPYNITNAGIFTIVIKKLNHQPMFLLPQPNISVLEDAFASQEYVDIAFAVDIGPGPVDAHHEAAQRISFSVQAHSSGWSQGFSVRPVLYINGTLVFRTAKNMFGSFLFEAILSDDGGSADAGSDSSSVFFQINVLSVNRAPSFQLTHALVVMEDSPDVLEAIAFNISAGEGEFYQRDTLYFQLVAGSETFALFAKWPLIAGSNGVLSFALNADAHGVAEFSVTLADTGSLDNGGHNLSAAQSLHIMVQSVNDPPIFRVVPGNTSLLHLDVTVNTSQASMCDSSTCASACHNECIASNESSESSESSFARCTRGCGVLEARDVVASEMQIVVYESQTPVQSIVGMLDNVFAGPHDERLVQNLSVDIQLLQLFVQNKSASPAWVDGVCADWQGRSITKGMVWLAPVSSFAIQTQLERCQELCEAEWLVPRFTGCQLSVENAHADCILHTSHDVMRANMSDTAQSFCFLRQHVSSTDANDIGLLFTGLPLLQLELTNQSLATMDAPRSLNVKLETAPFRHGVAVFSVSLKDSGGTEHGGVDERRVNVTINVLPRNSKPFAHMKTHIRVNESSTTCLKNFALNVSAGGEGLGLERQQRLRFKFRQIAGSVGIVSKISASCAAGSSLSQCHATGLDQLNDLVCASRSWMDSRGKSCADYENQPRLCGFENSPDMCCACGGGTSGIAPGMYRDCSVGHAALDLVLHPNRFGKIIFEVELIDDGATEQGGVDKFVQHVTIEVVPVNSPPSLQLTMDQGHDRVIWHQGAGQRQVQHFARAMTPGPFESHTLADCPLLNCGLPSSVAKPTLTCSGTCSCAQTSRTFSDGESNSHCQWLISAGSDIFLRFSEFNTYPDYDFVTLNRCFDAACSSVEQIARLSGTQLVILAPQAEFLSWTGFLQVIFTSSSYSWTQRSGFEATWGLVDEHSIYSNTSAPHTCAAEDFCENQSTVFELLPIDPVLAHSIFRVLPSIDIPSGTLQFEAYQHAFGQVEMLLMFKDSGARDDTELSVTKTFTIDIVSQSSFESCGVRVLEDSGSLDIHLADVWVGATSPPTPTNLSFSVTMDRPDLFTHDGMPTVDAMGVCHFKLMGDQFGDALITLELRDDGGTQHGRRDRSGARTFPFVVLPKNDPPSFVLTTSVVYINAAHGSAGQHRFDGFADEILAGPRNENCVTGTLTSFCQAQEVTFRVTHISRPDVFSSIILTKDGVLRVELSELASGWVSVSVVLTDDGAMQDQHAANSWQQASCELLCDKPNATLAQSAPESPGGNVSPEQSFWVQIHREDSRPGFSLNSVECVTQDDVAQCSCPNNPTLQLCKQPSDLHSQKSAEVQILEGRQGEGKTFIENFATLMSPSENLYPSSLALYHWNTSSQSLTYHGMEDDLTRYVTVGVGQDEHLGNIVAADSAVSPDGRHVYHAEFETNTLAVSSTDGQFVQRRAHGERRLRFGSFWMQEVLLEVQQAVSQSITPGSTLSVLTVAVHRVKTTFYSCHNQNTAGWSVFFRRGSGFSIPICRHNVSMSPSECTYTDQCSKDCVVLHTAVANYSTCMFKCHDDFSWMQNIVPTPKNAWALRPLEFDFCVFDSLVSESIAIDLQGTLHLGSRFALKTAFNFSLSRDFIGQSNVLMPHLIMSRHIRSGNERGLVICYQGHLGRQPDSPSDQGTPLYTFEVTLLSNNSMRLSSSTKSSSALYNASHTATVFTLWDTVSNRILRNISLAPFSSVMMDFNRLCAGTNEADSEERVTADNSTDCHSTSGNATSEYVWQVLCANIQPLQIDKNVSALPDLGFDWYLAGINVRSNLSVVAQDLKLFSGGDLQYITPPNFTLLSLRSIATTLPTVNLVVGKKIVEGGGRRAYIVRYECIQNGGQDLMAVVEYTLFENNTLSISVGKTPAPGWEGLFVLHDANGILMASASVESHTSRSISLNGACGCPSGLERQIEEGQSADIMLETQDACLVDAFTLKGLSHLASDQKDLQVIATFAAGCQNIEDALLDTADVSIDAAVSDTAPSALSGEQLRQTVCRPGLLGSLGLWEGCDEACCLQLLAHTKGYWDMHLDSIQFDATTHRLQNFSTSSQNTVKCSDNGCSSRRPRSDCGEGHDTEVFPAAVTDRAQLLGMAVLLGPPCKIGPQQDWDVAPRSQAHELHSSGDEATPPSLETFIMGSQFHQALQFDGVLNTGLYVTDDIALLSDASQLPTRELSLEVCVLLSFCVMLYTHTYTYTYTYIHIYKRLPAAHLRAVGRMYSLVNVYYVVYTHVYIYIYVYIYDVYTNH